MFDAKPEDRDSLAVFPLSIDTDHKVVDGNVVAVDKITLGKRGAPNYQQVWEVNRLKKDDPFLWRALEPVYENWKKNNTITTDGHPLEAWPALSKGQLKAYKDLGLRSVEDIAAVTDAVREKMGMDALDIVRQAKAFLASKADSAASARTADLEKIVGDLKGQLEAAQATIDELMAERGKKPTKPNLQKAAA